jgi:4-nitrophenyl phosphatase
LGIKTDLDSIFGSAYCAAYYLSQTLSFKKKVYVVGMTGITSELEDVGIEWCGSSLDNQQLDSLSDMSSIIIEENVGAVLLGMDIDFNYRKLTKAFLHLQDKDCLFLATNDDLTYPAGKSLIYQ